MKPHMYPQPEEPDQYLYQPQPSGPAPAQNTDAPEGTDVRARLLRRFEVWLDEVLMDEDVPKGVGQDILERLQTEEETAPASDASDLFGLYAVLTALTEATHVQGRSFQQVQDRVDQLQSGISQLQGSCSQLQNGLSPVQSLVKSVESLAQRDAQNQEQQQAQARQTARQETIKTALDVLIDTRDRLVRAKALAQAKTGRTQPGERTGLLSKLLASGKGPAPGPDPSLMQELDQGLNRIDEALQQWNVRAIPCVGQTFDPQTMQAVERLEVTDKPDNTVLEVCREGYRWEDTVHRVAQVKVAIRPTGSGKA